MHQLWSVVWALRDSAESPCGGNLRVILRRLQDLREEEDIFEATRAATGMVDRGPDRCSKLLVVWLASTWVAEVGEALDELFALRAGELRAQWMS